MIFRLKSHKKLLNFDLNMSSLASNSETNLNAIKDENEERVREMLSDVKSLQSTLDSIRKQIQDFQETVDSLKSKLENMY